jgi:hypothetical protein
MTATTPTTTPTTTVAKARIHVANSASNVAKNAVLACGALVVASLAFALVSPSKLAFGLVVAAAVATIVALGQLPESFSVVGREIHHRTWLRSVAIDSDRIVTVERPDAESSVRELLMVDDAGRSISVPLSRLHDRDDFAVALEALLNEAASVPEVSAAA